MSKTRRWRRLDNAAQIFPSASNNANTYVFRTACQLYEEVDAKLLKLAVNKALAAFPLFSSVIKRGFFWYYLEESSLAPVVEPENLPLCSPIFVQDHRTLLFRVSYHKRRINLEVYHVLTDGTGGLEFLKMIVYYYLSLKYPTTEFSIPDYDASLEQMAADSYGKHYSGEHKAIKEDKIGNGKVYRIKGQRNTENRLSAISGRVSVQQTLQKAHEYNASMTVYLCAILIMSIYKDMPYRHRKRPIVVTVPVNLRQFFSSATARNFFSTIRIGYCFKNGEPSFSELIEHVKESFANEITEERLKKRLDKLAGFEHNVLARISPLVLKNVVLGIAYRISEQGNTTNMSNVGKVKVPDEYGDYIEQFEVLTSTTKTQVCLCSFKDTLTISFTSEFVSAEIQKNFFRALSNDGIDVEISANDV